ncbi:MAG: nucleotidyltransferase domain-containing protein [Nanoarchaeota archaeon]
MLEHYNAWKVLRVFFDNPNPSGAGFQLREISRKIHLAPVSVKRYLKDFIKDGLILKSRHRIHKYPVYWANRVSENFRNLKKINTILLIRDSGLLTYINDACMPDVVILFGSAARGEDLLESDLDLYVQCKEKQLNLNKYKTKLNRRINLFFSESFDKMSGELKNNILNGTILGGYLKVF